VEENDGVRGGGVEGFVGVWKERCGLCEALILVKVIVIVIIIVEIVVMDVVVVEVGWDGFGIGAAVDDAVIVGIPEAGQSKRAGGDEGVGVLGDGGRDMKNVEKALVDVWNEESLLS
jgi:hypothetical protein